MIALNELIQRLPDEVLLSPQIQRLIEECAGQAWATFQPRPDQPERYDQQTSFYESDTKGVAWMVGGNGAGTTTLTMAKVAKLVLGTPAPRPNTPFWVIANTYEQVMETCWVEKLHGMGFIPENAINWKKATWYRSSRDWPYSIPLHPRPGERGNWVLEFKSYDQGRTNMQARSIGGFAFIEQFPYSLLVEVLRGCREYSIPGAKFCEFTPIDPALSIEIEQMLENGHRPKEGADPTRLYLPDNWEVYRANTTCAMEAGHVTKEWYDEFFSMVPEEMRATRETGAFASYEGVIYQEFNPQIHLVDDDRLSFPFPNGVYHRRAIDWGAGPQNAFCCLWAYRDTQHRWWVYDEYYSTDQSKTTVDHLKTVSDYYAWPANSPNYGTTYADPSDPDNLRIAQKLNQYTSEEYQPLDMARAKNAVLEGIEHVRYLLKRDFPTTDPDTGEVRMEPRLFIHRQNCPNLSRQMRTYRWLRGTDSGLNPRDARPEPLKKEDHACDALRYLLFSEANETGRTIDSMKKGGEVGRAVERVRPLEIMQGGRKQKIIPGGRR